jgi:transposase-like protein
MKTIKPLIDSLKGVEKLYPKEFWQLKAYMNKLDIKKIVTLTLEEDADVKCGHCGSGKYVKNGRRSDLQRYKCKLCGKSFNQLTGTPLARLKKKGRWLNFSECLKLGFSVRKAATEVGVDNKTSFKWRHRFLQNSNLIYATKMNGAVEVKETKFKYSEKGSRVVKQPHRFGTDVYVLSMVNRSGSVATPLVEYFNIESIMSKKSTFIAEDSLMFSEGCTVLKDFASKINMKVFAVKSKVDKPNRLKHINNVENYNHNLHLWMKRFKGVATKYLHNYLSWFRQLDEHLMEPYPHVILVRAKSIERFPYRPFFRE